VSTTPRSQRRPRSQAIRSVDPIPDASTVDGFERAVVALVRQLGGRSVAAVVAERSGSDLPAASIVLLEHLEDSGPRRVSQIAADHRIGMPALTPRIKDLEAAGLISRATDPTDGRASLISLTGAGRVTLDRVRGARCGILADALEGLDPSALATASLVLANVAEALERAPRKP
jgi:DNA-binding MarR family transcriptional regulator